MQTLSIEQAEGHLTEIIEKLSPGEEIVLTRDGRPVAKLITLPGDRKPRPGPGLGKGMLTILSDDDEHLKDFAEYMP